MKNKKISFIKLGEESDICAHTILVRLWTSSFYSPLLKLFITQKKKKKKTLKPSIPYISERERWMVVC